MKNCSLLLTYFNRANVRLDSNIVLSDLSSVVFAMDTDDSDDISDEAWMNLIILTEDCLSFPSFA